jgi:hypothetical protein
MTMARRASNARKTWGGFLASSSRIQRRWRACSRMASTVVRRCRRCSLSEGKSRRLGGGVPVSIQARLAVRDPETGTLLMDCRPRGESTIFMRTHEQLLPSIGLVAHWPHRVDRMLRPCTLRRSRLRLRRTVTCAGALIAGEIQHVRKRARIRSSRSLNSSSGMLASFRARLARCC